MIECITLFCHTMFRIILTAAHCVKENGERLFVKIGDHDASRDGDAEYVTLRRGTAVKHPRYTSIKKGWDVALIKLDRDIKFSHDPHAKGEASVLGYDRE